MYFRRLTSDIDGSAGPDPESTIIGYEIGCSVSQEEWLFDDPADAAGEERLIEDCELFIGLLVIFHVAWLRDPRHRRDFTRRDDGEFASLRP